MLSAGLSAEDANWICDDLDNEGTAFFQYGVPADLSALICSLHYCAWACYGTHSEVFAPGSGGRQGCTLGGMIFNCAYTLALRVIHRRLKDAGIILRLNFHRGPFWASESEYDSGDAAQQSSTHVIDATFVDDECIILIAKSPRVLFRAIRILLDMCHGYVLEIFSWHKLEPRKK